MTQVFLFWFKSFFFCMLTNAHYVGWLTKLLIHVKIDHNLWLHSPASDLTNLIRRSLYNYWFSCWVEQQLQRLSIFFQGNSSFFWIRFYVNNFNLLFNCFFYILFTSTALDRPGLRPNEGWMRYIKIYLWPKNIKGLHPIDALFPYFDQFADQ